MSENIPKDLKIVIIGGTKIDIRIEKMEELKSQLIKETEGIIIAFSKLGASVEKASAAFIALGKTGMCFDYPEVNMTERFVMDSWYDEVGEITGRDWKKFERKRKKAKILSEHKNQKDIWCNKWDKKIKRKL